MMKLLANNTRAGFMLFILTILFANCSKMDDTYKQFLEDGMKVYIGKVDSVFVYPGNYRVQLGWLPPSDPKATTARVYWNNRQDSVNVPIQRGEIGKDTIKVMFDDFDEGTYVFEVFTFDNQGNRSLIKEVIGKVYGDIYNSTLLSRPIDAYEMSDDDQLKITWGAVPDPAVQGTQIVYEDQNGDTKMLFVSKDDLNTFIDDFPAQTIAYRTVYLPSPLAIDTYYTEYASLRIKGKPIELSKAGWTVEASSEDLKGAGRPASHAIDENPTTIWVNNTSSPTNVYPHTITVDMKTVHQDLEGFAIITRVGDAAARPKTIELYTSVDGDEWTFHLVTDLLNSGDKQFVALSESVQARYFRINATASFSGGNIALAEIGMYYR